MGVQAARYLPAGDAAVLVSFSDELSLEVNHLILNLWKVLVKERVKGIVEAVPTYRDLCVYYNPLEIEFNHLIKKLDELVAKAPIQKLVGDTFEIPVVYGGKYGPDLEYLARYHGLTQEEIIKRHSDTIYPVYMVGFAPGFPYLGGLDNRLYTPRRHTPVPQVPAGSVVIGGQQTAVITINSPTGWYVVGRTPIAFYDILKKPPTLIQPGDSVRFIPASELEYQNYTGYELWAKPSLK